MAFELPNFVISLPAAADLSAKQYFFVKIDSSGNCALASATGEAVIGVLQNKPDAAGKVAQVMVQGITKIVSGSGTITAGDLIASQNDGKAKTAVKGTVDTTGGSDSATAPLVGSSIQGRCIGTATTGNTGTMLLQPMGLVASTGA